MAVAGARGALGGSEKRQWRDDFVVSVLTSWMVLGLIIDGWNHINLQDGRLGAFLTPWHGILYSGFTAAVCWILTRGQTRGEWSVSRMPAGWGISLVGMGLALIGVVGDSVWHTLFGVEADVARMLAPFHLFLYIGVALVASTAARSAWVRLNVVPQPRELIPAVISLVTVLIVAGFTVQYLSPFMTWFPAEMLIQVRARTFGQLLEVLEVGGVVVWTVLLFGSVLVAGRRFKLPAGTATLVLMGSTGAIATLTQFSRGWSLIPVLAGALVFEICARRPTLARGAAPLGALVLWLGHYGVLANAYHVSFPVEIWGGAVGMGLLAAVGLSVIAGKIDPLGLASPAHSDAANESPSKSMVAYVQRFADLVGALEVRSTWQPFTNGELDTLFALVADAASVLTVGRMGIHVDGATRALLFNLTARAEAAMRRHHRAQVFAAAPSVADMANATLRHLDRESGQVIDLTREHLSAGAGGR